jgi:hypothetical protein
VEQKNFEEIPLNYSDKKKTPGNTNFTCSDNIKRVLKKKNNLNCRILSVLLGWEKIMIDSDYYTQNE